MKSLKRTIETRVGEIAKPGDIVLCEFKIESYQGRTLTVEEVERCF
ncbi:MAG: hypothetical protein FGF48_09010 [Candidatus Brockarchaeota archaeon]|nr:hypothetical protein [Candidatus Brockarchaeota archaeon]